MYNTLPNVERSTGNISEGDKVDGIDYLSDDEVLKLMRSEKPPLLLKPYGVYTYENKLIAPVPFEYMTDEEKSVYLDQKVRLGPNRGKTLRELAVKEEPQE